MAATLSFDLTTKLATVLTPDTSISCQEIYDQFRDYEDRPEVMSNKELVTASGKDTLAGGLQTVVTVRLLDGWRVKFADRAGPSITECVVTGGNLLASDEAGDNQIPIAPADYVFVSLANATTGALLNLADLALARKARTNRQELVNIGTTQNPDWRWRTYDDDDTTVLTELDHEVQDIDGKQIQPVAGSVAKRSKGGDPLP